MALTLDAQLDELLAPGGLTSSTFTFSTTNANDVICLFYFPNGSIVPSSVHSTNTTGATGVGTNWTMRVNGGGSRTWYMFWATATAALASEGIIVTYSGTNSQSNDGLEIIAVSGANLSAPFDAHAGLPSVATSPSISTSNANCFLVGTFAFNSTSDPTAGTGWTKSDISAGTFQMCEYRIVSATQSSLTIPIGTGSGDQVTGINIGDAIQAAATGLMGAMVM